MSIVRSFPLAVVAVGAIGVEPVSAWTEAPVLVEEAALLASDGVSSDRLAKAVAIDGDTIALGAPEDDSGALNGGAVYIFVRDASGWSEQAELLAPTPTVEAHFGFSVALADDRLVVGAPETNGPAGSDVGAVYVYRRSGSLWLLETDLVGLAAEDRLGAAVDIDPQRAIVGATQTDLPGGPLGYAQILRRSGTSWVVEGTLSPSVAPAIARYGTSVAIDGDLALVGDLRDGATPTGATGAAYVYRRDGSSWSEEAKLVASLGQVSASFGSSVALRGERALVGAPQENAGRGGAYLFERSPSGWTELQRLEVPDGFVFDQFGVSVALTDSVACVGDIFGPGGAGHGAVRVFVDVGSVWEELGSLIPSNAVVQPFGDQAQFAAALDVDGERLVVGAPFDELSGSRTGTGFVFGVPFLSFCDGGDGTTAFCPCASGGPTAGCEIAQGTGGVTLRPVTQDVAGPNRATLTGSGFPSTTAPSVLVMRSATRSVSLPPVFGDGLLCVGAPLVRLAATAASGGTSTHTVGHSPMAGSGAFYYQLWFRNTPLSYCDPSAGFNTSNGRRLEW